MPWVRFDDQFPIHRKVEVLSDRAFRLHVRAIFWCARNLTDGFVHRRELSVVAGRMRGPGKCVAELVASGLWIEQQDGWIIHDYLDYQPSRERVLATRDARTQAGRKGGVASGNTRRGRSKEASKPEANSFDSASRLLEHPSRPVPSIADVSQSSTRRNAHAYDDETTRRIEQTIIDVLAAETNRTVTPDWAAKVRAQILDGRDVARPISYVTRALRERPRDFLPTAGAMPGTPPPPDPLDGLDPAPLGQRDNPANVTGLAAARAALAASKKPRPSQESA